MAVDTAEKRKAIAGIHMRYSGPGVTPNVLKDQEWRQEAGWGYNGILVATPAAPPPAVPAVTEQLIAPWVPWIRIPVYYLGEAHLSARPLLRAQGEVIKDGAGAFVGRIADLQARGMVIVMAGHTQMQLGRPWEMKLHNELRYRRVDSFSDSLEDLWLLGLLDIDKP